MSTDLPLPGNAATRLRLRAQFNAPEQQHTAATVGMWVFLGTEIMFFGGLFTAYSVYRALYPDAFALGSRHLSAPLGTLNTAVLITSSYTVVLALRAARQGRRRALLTSLAATIILGLLFLAIKTVEWHGHYKEHLFPGLAWSPPPASGRLEMFFILYYFMTGLHALHVIIGLGVFATLSLFALSGRITPAYTTPVEVGGLYWHFVDIIWIFLYPLLYLIALH